MRRCGPAFGPVQPRWLTASIGVAEAMGRRRSQRALSRGWRTGYFESTRGELWHKPLNPPLYLARARLSHTICCPCAHHIHSSMRVPPASMQVTCIIDVLAHAVCKSGRWFAFFESWEPDRDAHIDEKLFSRCMRWAVRCVCEQPAKRADRAIWCCACVGAQCCNILSCVVQCMVMPCSLGLACLCMLLEILDGP